MTEAMPFLQKYDITFLRPPTIPAGGYAGCSAYSCAIKASASSTVCMCSSIRTTMLL